MYLKIPPPRFIITPSLITSASISSLLFNISYIARVFKFYDKNFHTEEYWIFLDPHYYIKL